MSPEALRTAVRAIRRAAPSNPPPPPEIELLPVAPLTFRVRWRAAHATAPETETPLVLRTMVTEAEDVVRAQFDTVLEAETGERRISIRHDGARVEILLGWLLPDGGLRGLARVGPVAAIPAARAPRPRLPADASAPCGPQLSSPFARPGPSGTAAAGVMCMPVVVHALSGESGVGAGGAEPCWPLALGADPGGGVPV